MTQAAARPLVDLDPRSAGATRGERGPWRTRRRRRRVPYLVVGRTAVVPLLPGTLLTRSLIGDAAFPPAGKVVASLAVKPGQYPQGLAAGARVAVFLSAANATGGTQTSTGAGTTTTRLSAVVLGVDPRGDGQGATVVTLLLDASDAGRLAGAGGVVLMQTAPGGD